MEFRTFLLIAATIFIVFLFMLGCTNDASHPKLSTLRRFFFNRVPSGIKWLLGPRIWGFFNWMKDYLFFSNNPLTAIFYCVLFPGAYMLYLTTVIIPFFEEIGWVNIVLGHIVILSAVASYLLTFLTGPGVVSRFNVEAQSLKYEKYFDEDLFPRGKACKTCRIPKFADQTPSLETLLSLRDLRAEGRPSLHLDQGLRGGEKL